MAEPSEHVQETSLPVKERSEYYRDPKETGYGENVVSIVLSVLMIAGGLTGIPVPRDSFAGTGLLICGIFFLLFDLFMLKKKSSDLKKAKKEWNAMMTRRTDREDIIRTRSSRSLPAGVTVRLRPDKAIRGIAFDPFLNGNPMKPSSGDFTGTAEKAFNLLTFTNLDLTVFFELPYDSSSEIVIDLFQDKDGFGVRLPAGVRYIPSADIEEELRNAAVNSSWIGQSEGQEQPAEIPVPIGMQIGVPAAVPAQMNVLAPVAAERMVQEYMPAQELYPEQRPSAENAPLFLFETKDVIKILNQIIAVGTIGKGGVGIGDVVSVADRDHNLLYQGASVIGIKDGQFRQLEFANEGDQETVGIILDCFSDTDSIRQSDIIFSGALPGRPVQRQHPADAEIRQQADPVRGRFQPYTGSGLCDVCHQYLTGKAWSVPNDLFYGSPKYRDYLNQSRAAAALAGREFTEEDLAAMRAADPSESSAVCENCIHLFL